MSDLACFVGIDSGKSGAVAVIVPSVALEIFDTPTLNVGKGSRRAYDERGMADLLEETRQRWSGISVGLELQHSFPSEGVSSSFAAGEGFGIWKGILSALKIQWQLVTPQRWKKALMDGQSKEKSASCLVAARLYPAAQSLVYGKRGGAMDGRADALLIATYVMRMSG